MIAVVVVLLMALGFWALWMSRKMDLSRRNEHGVRMWTSAMDSLVAPVIMGGLRVVAAGLILGPPYLATREPSFEPAAGPEVAAPMGSTAAERAPAGAPHTPNSSVALSGVILAQSERQLLTPTDVAHLSVDELRIARNEIFARRGRVFTDPTMRAHFQQFDWYRPTSEEVQLSVVEAANVRFLSEEEERREAGSGALGPQSEMGPIQPEVSDEPATHVNGLFVRRATTQERARLNFGSAYGLIIVNVSPDSWWRGTRADGFSPEIGDILLSANGFGTFTDPAQLQPLVSYVTRTNTAVCVDARRAADPRNVIRFCIDPEHRRGRLV